MRLSASLILFKFKQSPNAPAIAYDTINAGDEPLTRPRLLRAEAWISDALYICTPESAAAVETLPPHLFIAGLPGGAPIAGVVYVDMQLVDLFNAVDDIFSGFNAVELDFRRAVDTDAPLRVLLNTAARFFDNPVTLCDTSLRFIDTSDCDIDGELPEYFRTALKTRYIDGATLEILHKRRIDHELFSARTAMFIEIEEISATYLTKSVYFNNELIASVTVFEVFSPLDRSMGIILEQIADVMCSTALKGTNAARFSFEVTVRSMLAGERVAPEAVSAALSLVDWSENDRFRFLLVRPGEVNLSSGTAKYFYSIIHGLIPGSLIVELKDSAVVIAAQKQMKKPLEAYLTQVESHLKKDAAVMVSVGFKGFSELNANYKAVRDAFYIARRYEPSKKLYKFEDYVSSLMLAACSERYDLKVFCSGQALTLYEYDKTHNRDLLKSICTYLAYNKSLAGAASYLHIHPNTLSYRVSRACAVADIDIEDAASCSALCLSYEIFRYIGSNSE